MDKENKCKYSKDGKHDFVPLGFQRIATEQTKVEVIACIACRHCGVFRTKMLYFDRQRSS